MTTAFAARDISKAYGKTIALEGVSLKVAEGEIVGLLGPNGAGKSTLVKIACGLVRPTGGTAEVCGVVAGSQHARAAVGYLAELFRFPGWLKAEELLVLHQQLSRSNGGEAERHDLLDLVGLGHVPQRRIDQMSKGMQQRLGIAQALVGSPKVLFLDEPTSALDPAGRRAVREILENVHTRGITIFLNSHLLSEVELICDRVVILSKGRILAEGNPRDMIAARGVEIETQGGAKVYPDVGREDIPRLVRELAAAGEQIYAVRPNKPTLEDVYIDTVGEDVK
jgi:ABC-2 type transport system ATP-binding protein